MATKKAKQTKQAKKEVVFDADLLSLQKQILQMNRMLDEFVACSRTNDEWLATLVSLSVEAAKVAALMGFKQEDFLSAVAITTEEVYEKLSRGDFTNPFAPTAKPAKKAVKKPVKPAKKAVKKPVKTAKKVKW